jgi:hypothetical protein
MTVAPAAQARFITIEANVNAGIEGSAVRTLVNVTNRGDEPAHNVVVRAEVGGVVKTGHLREALLPNERYSETFETPVEYRKAGRYPIIVTTDYTDGNQYPFSALSIVHLNYQENIPGRVVGEIAAATVGSSGSVKLTIRNLGQTEERLNARLLVPQELSVSPANRDLRIKPGGEESAAFKVRNVAALPGSQYQVYALLDYEQDNYHFSNVVGGQITIEPTGDPLAWYTAPLIAVAIAVGGALAYVNLRRRPRRHAAS